MDLPQTSYYSIFSWFHASWKVCVSLYADNNIINYAYYWFIRYFSSGFSSNVILFNFSLIWLNNAVVYEKFSFLSALMKFLLIPCFSLWWYFPLILLFLERNGLVSLLDIFYILSAPIVLLGLNECLILMFLVLAR